MPKIINNNRKNISELGSLRIRGNRMSEKQTITVNGRQYDAHTGLAVDGHGSIAKPTQPSVKPPHASRPTTAATSIHTRTQRSHTLNRKAIKRPEHKKPAVSLSHEVIIRKPSTLHAHRPAASQASGISKFAPHPVHAPAKPVMDIGPAAHPHVVKAHALSAAKASRPLAAAPAPKRPPTPSEIKQSAIHNAIENTNVNHNHVAKKRLLKRHPRTLSIVSASIALVVLGGYLTYLNMPSLSVRVAAAQAGINAAYPNYRPDGYSLNGTVGYSQGKVTMKFASNGGPSAFTINQTKSNWDSDAVLDNYVSPRAGASYIPYTERGLTIYTYGNSAAWVNGGILYTIEGDAPLSSEQIRRIATSLI